MALLLCRLCCLKRSGLSWRPRRWRADRARIVLACAEGMSDAAAAQPLGVAVKSVSKPRRQFAADRLAGLEDAAACGAAESRTGADRGRAAVAGAVGD